MWLETCPWWGPRYLQYWPRTRLRGLFGRVSLESRRDLWCRRWLMPNFLGRICKISKSFWSESSSAFIFCFTICSVNHHNVSSSSCAEGSRITSVIRTYVSTLQRSCSRWKPLGTSKQRQNEKPIPDLISLLKGSQKSKAKNSVVNTKQLSKYNRPNKP